MSPKDDQTEIGFLPDADEIERRPMPAYARLTVHSLTLMLAAFLAWAAVAELDQVVVAQGRLATPSANIVVQPLETAIIQKIHVRVGQVVRKGDLLATLDPTFADADQAQLQTKYNSMDNQIRRLEAELGGPMHRTVGKMVTDDTRLQDQLSVERRANFAAQSARITENMARLRASMETNLRDQQSLGERVKSLSEVEAMQQKLVDQKFGAKVTLLEAQNRRMEVERDYIQSKNREAELRREMAALEAEKSAFVKGWRQKIMEDLLALSRERDAVAEQMKKGDLRHTLVNLTAPADAVVLEIGKLSQGSVIKEAEPLFTMVPIGSELDAEVQINSLDIGYVKPGDVAHIKFDAFPFQKHGTMEAKVRTVSEDAFRRENQVPGQGTDAYYLSRIDFGTAKLKNMDNRNRLLPGMTVTAEIVVGKRTVLSYLAWPLTKGLNEALREP